VLKNISYRRLILGLGSAAAGAVLGVALQSLLDTELRLTAALVAVLCLGLIGILVTLASQSDTLIHIEEEVLGRTAELVSHTEAASANLLRQTEEASSSFTMTLRQTGDSLLESIETLRRQVGLHVAIQLLQQVNELKSAQEDLVIQAVEQAKSEILVLDLLSSSGVRPDIEMRKDLMVNHLDTILRRVRESVPGISYRRICQVDGVDSKNVLPFAGVQDNAFIEHCVQMCHMRAAGKEVVLRVTRKTYPYKFVIIDQETLVLQLHHLEDDKKGEEQRIWCELIIADPKQELMPVFLRMWRSIEDDPETRTISLQQLGNFGIASLGNAKQALRTD